MAKIYLGQYHGLGSIKLSIMGIRIQKKPHDEPGSITHLWNIPWWNIQQTCNLRNHGIFQSGIFHGCANSVSVEYSIVECSIEAHKRNRGIFHDCANCTSVEHHFLDVPQMRNLRNHETFHGGIFHSCVINATVEYSTNESVEYSIVAQNAQLRNI